MGKISLIFATIIGIIFGVKAELKLSAQLLDGSAVAGVPLQLELQANKRIDSNSIQLPKLTNGSWQNNRQQTNVRIINGAYTISYVFTILPEHEGELIIPPIQVTHNKKKFATFVIKLKVSPPGSNQIDLSKDLFGKWVINSPKKEYYAGEEISAELHLYVLQGRRARITIFPQFSNFTNVLFVDKSDKYPEPNHPLKNFSPPKERTLSHEGKIYSLVSFPFAFKILQPGTISPQAKVTLQVTVPREKSSRRRESAFPFDDDFFPSFISEQMAQTINYNVVFQDSPKFNIRPLPSAPEGVNNLNLVGSWELDCKLTRSLALVGEPVELTISGKGKSAPELLTAPQLNLQGFRVYPPEIKKRNNDFILRYALIPLIAGEQNLSLKLTFFNPAEHKYQIKKFNFSIPVSQSSVTSTAPVITTSVTKTPATNISAPPVVPPTTHHELLYQKPAAGPALATPLAANQFFAIILILLSGAIIGIILDIYTRLRRNRDGNPQLLRRKTVQKQLNYMLKILKNHKNPDDYLRQEMLPLIAEVMGLAPGATASEIAKKINNPELSAFFRELDNLGFQPNATPNHQITPALIKELSTMLKICGILVTLLTTYSLTGTNFNDSFDKGNYANAITEYLQSYNQVAPQPNICYNLGGTYFQQKNYHHAWLWLMRAHLLNPNDKDTLDNLNVIQRKLNQADVYQLDTLSGLLHYCRNTLRPDGYLVVIALAIAIILITWGGRTLFNHQILLYSNIFSVIILLLSTSAIISQITNDYNSNKVMVINNKSELRSLPASGSGRILETLAIGTKAKIIDNRGEWLRIQTSKGDGWVSKKQVEKIFPFDIW